VCLESEAFTAQGYKNFKPKFAIQGWLDDSQLEVIASGEEYDLEELLGNPVKKVSELPPPATTGRRRRA
jgi:hypothetical protein